eukprot:Lithocolla_globosa_v1_NODE_9813_length_665_cov_11.688525.p2 type:complete len:130 gc:universal NODE_9813_length_665_cov_11.688525:195-584(+)
MSSISLSVNTSLSSSMIFFSSDLVMNPSLSVSKMSNVSLICCSCRLSFSLMKVANIVQNSVKSMLPAPLTSTSLNMSSMSATEGFIPIARITSNMSPAETCPSPFLSYKANASLHIMVWSSSRESALYA